MPFKLLLPLLPFFLLSHNSSDHCLTRDIQMEAASEHDFCLQACIYLIPEDDV